jgi:hypothetical protein
VKARLLIGGVVAGLAAVGLSGGFAIAVTVLGDRRLVDSPSKLRAARAR